MEDQRRILTYTLRTELGHDRLGRVFRALDTRTMRPVVLRLLRVGGLVPFDREEAVRTEVRRMLRAAANVAHPNIAPILDIAAFRDLDLVAWEDLDGRPLADRLADGAPAVEALRWAIEAVSAISRAHSREVPHGRISLANVIVARDDGVRVLDLGVPRPRAVPFLVEDEPDLAGRLRPVRRNLPRLFRKDLTALVEVVREIVRIAPPHTDDRLIRDEIVAAVDESIEAVMAGRRPTAAQLHNVLVEVARRTPVDGRRLTGLLRPPEPRPTVPATVSRAVSPPIDGAGTGAAAAPSDGADAPPFSLLSYGEYNGPRPSDRHPPTPPMRVWGAAAFEADPEDDDDDPDPEAAIAAFDPREPPLMTTVLLPELTPQDDIVEDQFRAIIRGSWRQLALAVLIGVLLAFGLFALDLARRGVRPGVRGPAAQDAASAAVPPGVQGSPAAGLGAPPRPIARPGQPSGTLVISTTQRGVMVSVDGSRAEPAPITWDDLPAGRRIVHLSAPGFNERVDTINVAANLTTTRFYVLTPVR